MIKHRIEIPSFMKEKGIPLIGAELGCAEGYFSNDLLERGLETLYMVDAWATLQVKGDGSSPQAWHDANYEQAMARVKKHGNKVIVLRGLTTEMAKEVPDGSLGLVYLDAGHSYGDVMADLKAWTPKVMNGGLISGHDFLNRAYGVQDAVKDFWNGKIYLIPENKSEDAGFLFFK